MIRRMFRASATSFLLLTAIPLGVLGCNRGPEPPPVRETQAPPPVEPTVVETGPDERTEVRPQAPFDPASPALGGMKWSAPEAFVYRRPTRPMRNAEYAIAGSAGEAEMTVFHFPGMGGSIDDNIARWVGQFRKADGTPAEAETSERTVGGLSVHLVDVRGNFSAGMMAGGGTQAGQRLLGAIVQAPAGPVFFKLVGPEATVESASDAFDAFVLSFGT